MLHHISAWFGQQLGSLFGTLVSIALYLLVVILAWGIWWDRILTKAGFEGKAFWRLFLLIVGPAAVYPLIEETFGAHSDITTGFAAISGLCVYGSLVAIALMPWPVRKKKLPKVNVD